MATRTQKTRNDRRSAPSRQVLGDALVKRHRGKHNLQELVKRVPKGYKREEVDLGDPVGKEIA